MGVYFSQQSVSLRHVVSLEHLIFLYKILGTSALLSYPERKKILSSARSFRPLTRHGRDCLTIVGIAFIAVTFARAPEFFLGFIRMGWQSSDFKAL